MTLSEDPTRSGAASAHEAPEAQDHQSTRSPRRRARVIGRRLAAPPTVGCEAMTARSLAMASPCRDSAELSRARAHPHGKTYSRVPARRPCRGNRGIGGAFGAGSAGGALWSLPWKLGRCTAHRAERQVGAPSGHDPEERYPIVAIDQDPRGRAPRHHHHEGSERHLVPVMSAHLLDAIAPAPETHPPARSATVAASIDGDPREPGPPVDGDFRLHLRFVSFHEHVLNPRRRPPAGRRGATGTAPSRRPRWASTSASCPGLSIMPDNRDNLTVGELIDLVAYLRTLEAKPGPAGAGS